MTDDPPRPAATSLGVQLALDCMGNPLNNRRAELAMLAASASGTTRMTMVRVTAVPRKRPRPQIAPLPVAARRRKSIDGEMRGLHPGYSAPGVNSNGLASFEAALRAELTTLVA